MSAPNQAADTTRKEAIESLERRFSPSRIGRRRRKRAWTGLLWLIWLECLNGAKRVFDFVAALILLVALAPMSALLYLYARARGGGLERSQRLGRWAVPFTYYVFRFNARADGTPLAHLPALLHVVRGDMSLIGPRAVSPENAGAAERLAWKRYSLRPGLICLWWIRQRANIAYASEMEIDAEYAESQSFWGDLGIALRAVPAVFYGQGVAAAPDRIRLLGVPIDNLTMDEALACMLSRIDNRRPTQVCFVNADCVNIAFRDGNYHRLLQGAGLVLADGIGIKVAGKILNRHIRQNVNGTDLFPRLCEALGERGLGIYLLGGKPGVAADVAKWIAQNHPKVDIRGHQHGYFSEVETPEIVQRIADTKPDILLVAFGVPKQEIWVRDHLDQTGAWVAMGVGGLFDFYSGRIPRAPIWMREVGMEWLFRFLQEPQRMWRRYFVGNVVFLFCAIRDRVTAADTQPV